MLSEYSASVNWGDGHTTGGTVTSDGSGGWIVTASHIYDDSGSYTLGVSITSNVGGSASASSTATIANVAPTAGITGMPTGNATAGTAVTLSANVNDPSGADAAAGFTDSWTVTKNGTSFTSGTGGSFTFTPDDNGTYGVSLSATDKDGGTSAPATASITANPSVIAVTIPGISATAGQSFTGTVATFNDTNPNATAGQYTASIAWGDGSTSAGVVVVDSGGGFDVTGTHTYSTGSPTVGDVLSVTVTRDSQHAASGSGTAVVTEVAPTLATTASATLASDGRSAALSVLGADVGGEGRLTYTWATIGTPPAAVTFGTNGSNGAKSSTATFSGPGTYDFEVTISNGSLSTTSSTSVTVSRELTGQLNVAPGTGWVNEGQTQQFSATDTDQFGSAFVPSSISWSVTGAGSIDSTGLYTAPASTGSATITAASGAVSGTASASVVDPAKGRDGSKRAHRCRAEQRHAECCRDRSGWRKQSDLYVVGYRHAPLVGWLFRQRYKLREERHRHVQ